MKRAFYIYLAALFATASSAFVIASAQAGVPSAHVARDTEVVLHRTSLGDILSTSNGFTLYEFTKDHGSDSCAKTSGCLQVWPALQSSGKPKAGSGVRASLLSTIKLPGGATQVIYAGHPLYLYSGDSKPGQTSYVGVSEFGGAWYALDAAGGAVK